MEGYSFYRKLSRAVTYFSIIFLNNRQNKSFFPFLQYTPAGPKLFGFSSKKFALPIFLFHIEKSFFGFHTKKSRFFSGLFVKTKARQSRAFGVFLFFADRAHRTAFRTGTAGNAGIRVDLVMRVARADRADRASSFACAAGNAFVADFISHDSYLRLK